MKIEERFKDLKDLLILEKVMNKHRDLMEKMGALVLIAYAIGLLLGEAVRDRMDEEAGGGSEGWRRAEKGGLLATVSGR